MQMIDGWTNVGGEDGACINAGSATAPGFCGLGSRYFTTPGDYALAGPGWNTWARTAFRNGRARFADRRAGDAAGTARYVGQNSRDAMRAPSAIAAIFAQTTSASTAACPTHVP